MFEMLQTGEKIHDVLLLYSVQHFRYIATCAAALRLPKLRARTEQTLELKPRDKYCLAGGFLREV